MKKYIIVITSMIILVSLIIIVYAYRSDISSENLIQSAITLADTNDVILTTEYEIYDKDIREISFYIENNTSSELTFGAEYALEVNNEGTWYGIPYKENTGWYTIAYSLLPNSKTSETIHLSIFDYSFKDGEYRIIKKVKDSFYYATFQLGDSNITSETPFGFIDLNKLAKNYNIDKAKKDGVVIFSYDKTYNSDKISSFFDKIKLYTSSMLRIMKFTVEGDPIIIDIIYDNKDVGKFQVRVDNTRDKFGSNECISNTYYSYVITDGESIYLSNCVSFEVYEKHGLLDEPYMIVDKSQLNGTNSIDTITTIMTDNMKYNITRYMKYNSSGSWYASIPDKEYSGNRLEFGFGSIERGSTETIVDSKGIVTDIYGIDWIDSERFVLLCKTTEHSEYYALFDVSKEEITDSSYGIGYTIKDGNLSILE